MTKHFLQTKRLFRKAMNEIVAEEISYEIKEAAFPSYAHGNPLIDYLFWKRLKYAYRKTMNHGSGLRVLDFGCGSGVMSYMLASAGHQITAVDVEFRPLEKVKSKISFPANVNFREGDLTAMDIEPLSFDVILALDVLEHIETPESLYKCFAKILKPGGVLIVSGPTENFLYKIGRKLAGKEFTGEYHHKNIADIKRELKVNFETGCVTRLIWPVSLFHLFTAKPRVQTAKDSSS